jgi:ankyrin repeat protein
MYDQVGIAEILLKHGADVTAKEGYFRETPLHVAAKSDSLNVVKLLLDHGVDINILGDGPRPPSKPPLPEHLIIPVPYSSPLDLAAAAGSERVVGLLLERGAKLDANPKKSAFSALHRAMGGWYNVSGYGNLKRQVDPTTRAAPGNRKVIEMLLAHGASLDDTDFFGSKPFHTGVCRLACDSVEYLLEKHGDEIDVNEPGQFESTPLQLVLQNAPRNGEEAAKTMMKILLKHGADLNVVAGPGYVKVTAFEYARENKWGEPILELLRPLK